MGKWNNVLGRTVVGAAVLGLGLAGTFGQTATGVHASGGASAPTLQYDGKVFGTAQYGTDGGATPSHTARTIPYWDSSFTSAGKSYPITMVGAAPSTNQSTAVATEIIPLNFTFADGVTLAGSSDVGNVLSSPIFQNNPWNTFAGTNLGTSQYGDAVQRVEFNKANTGYHVQLQNQQVLPTQTIAVPKNQGFEVHSYFGLMSSSWFAAREQNLIQQLHIPSTVVPIFLTDSVFLYIGNPNNCCILGWHGASSSLNGNGQQEIQTYIFAAYSKYDFFGRYPIMDIHALSHEVSEWLNDPFVNNLVPAWSVPFEPQYGCSNYLEAGDPLVGFSPNTSTSPGSGWHPQDIPLAPWFERQASPGSLADTYTYPDTATTLASEGAFGFNTYSPGC